MSKRIVRVYFKTNRRHDFPARSLENARDIAGRCVSEYVWIVHKDGKEEFFPTTEIHKVVILNPKEVKNEDQARTCEQQFNQ